MKDEPTAIQTISESKSRIEVVLKIDENALQTLNISALITQIGTAANERGAALSAATDMVAASETVQMTQFRTLLSNDHFTAIAKPLFNEKEFSQWRAQIFSHPKNSKPSPSNLVAEVIQRFSYRSVTPAEEAKQVITLAKNNGSLAASSIKLPSTTAEKNSSIADKRLLQIFEGACEVISKKGWANASIRDITKAAGIPIPTMYQYISSKEDILYLVTSICMEEILEYFQNRIVDDKPPIESLLDAVTAYFLYIDKNRRYINLLYSETRSLNEENRNRIFNLEKKFVKLWEAILIRGNESGDFQVKNTDLAANLIYFLCTSWSLRHWNIGRYSEKEVRDLISHIILQGISNKQ